ncbi:MAG: aminopeptidase [Deltaproteobacteria bacterium]|nr:aminopeptidase [Deltaproteobacteria bacterium]
MNGIKAATLSWLTMSLSLLAMGCSPLYITQAVYQESLILLRRRSISKVIADPNTHPDLKIKLQLVLDARAFAMRIGLEPRGSFTKYTHMDQDVLTWVLAASRPDAFILKQWWFPFVGRVPYRGFFEKADALSAAAALQDQGYETSIRGAEAFSTLGWFNDPVLSTTLQRSAPSIVETVLHESTHSTIWVPGHVDFNESLANFVGIQGTLD